MRRPITFAAILWWSAVAGAQTPSPFTRLQAEDRAVQAGAVAEFIAECDACTSHLVGIWRTTDRFDVRARIAEVLRGLGDAGIDPLIELSSDLNTVNDDGQRNLIIEALAPAGPDAMEALVARIESHPDRFSNAFFQPLATRLGIDAAPFVERLIGSDDPRVREKAIYGPIDLMPVPARSRAILVLVRDADERVRQAAAGRGLVDRWSDADRAADPDGYRAAMEALIELAASPDDLVARAAAKSVRVNPNDAGSALPVLRAVYEDGSRGFWAKSEAMRAAIAVAPDRGAEIGAVCARLDADPGPVCVALADCAAHEVPGALIPRLVALAPSTRGREENYAIDLLVRLGDRSVGPTIAALTDSDDAVSGSAAAVIARLGPMAIDAEPVLVEQLRTRGSGWQGEAYANALVAIGADSKAFRDAMASVVRSESIDPMDMYAAGSTLRLLMRERGEEQWVRELAEPVMRSASHPVHEWIVDVCNPSVDVDESVIPGEQDVALLSHQIRYGAGDSPQNAMAALGRTRPITPEILDLIASHLDDPRYAMRSAAVAAAGDAGPDAAPVVPILVELGHRSLGRAMGTDVCRAVERIAPDDPSVIALIGAHDEATRRPRTVTR